ncbi:MAG: cation diffusion facilitator family transporter [Mobiluncus porci]|uniref:Cation transporter n=1 Tax=Mobiluncus porci TaxID=2652278 RepID=A0A7K0K2Z2_9ACTO|nr:cation diffusion facilitator family transporter [Mobiluncus porci]MDD7542030.1 cation diffusion facilitator family transporter [Mobiluncus porci]MDY5747652.1 cation diffusion facilitator family transporter [Mobiluncus porci]MST49861.1 cation transporter [Mobiluncus porci]
MPHDHSHTTNAGASRLWFALAVTVTVFVVEIVGAVLTSSLAVVVDLGHVFTDLCGLIAALVAAKLSTLPATSRRTWGWARAEVLAAAFQALVLIGVGGYAVVEAIRRLISPEQVQGQGLLLVGIIGLIGNCLSLAVLSGSRDKNLNLRAAFLEVFNDALGSLAVIVSAIVISATGWYQADAIASLGIAVLIVPRALAILKTSTRILMGFTPKGLDLEAVRSHLQTTPHIIGVHDVHAATVSSGMPVFSAHLVLPEECFFDGHSVEVLQNVENCLREHHAVALMHTTIQLEPPGFAHAHADNFHE